LNASDAIGVERHLTSNSQMLSASDVAPYGALSSWVPTIGAGASLLGLVLPSTSGGSSPSPIRLSGTSLSFARKPTARAPGSPSIILLRSSPYTPIP
jgi:hypothetical protein